MADDLISYFYGISWEKLGPFSKVLCWLSDNVFKVEKKVLTIEQIAQEITILQTKASFNY